MSLWRSILRWFGLRREARVQITAPGIEVSLAGDPTQVRALMGVIRTELERKARRDRRLNKVDDGQVVRPTELDEMDSPYALPEAVVLPVPDDERGEDRHARLVAMAAQDPDTLPRRPEGDLNQTTDPSLPSTTAPLGSEGQRLGPASLPAYRPVPRSGPDGTEAGSKREGADKGRGATAAGWDGPGTAEFGPEDVDSVRTALTPQPEDGPTPPMAHGVRAASPADIDTLEVDRRLKRVTRPLHPAVKASDDSTPA